MIQKEHNNVTLNKNIGEQFKIANPLKWKITRFKIEVSYRDIEKPILWCHTPTVSHPESTNSETYIQDEKAV